MDLLDEQQSVRMYDRIEKGVRTKNVEEVQGTEKKYCIKRLVCRYYLEFWAQSGIWVTIFSHKPTILLGELRLYMT